MTYPLTIQPEAEADLAAAFCWYEEQRSGLGLEFLDCVEEVWKRISSTPELHAATYRGVRQALVRRFPYVVCYLFESNEVEVIAVFHGHRDPKSWQSRVQ